MICKEDAIKAKELLNIKGDVDTLTTRDVKKAYHKALLRVHPDVNKESNAKEKTIELNQAYDTLKKYLDKEPNEKQKYEAPKREQESQNINEYIEKAMIYLNSKFKFNFNDNSDEYILMQQEYLKGVYKSLLHDLKWDQHFQAISKQMVNEKIKSFKNDYNKVLFEIFNNKISENLPFLNEYDRNNLFMSFKQRLATRKEKDFNADVNDIKDIVNSFSMNESLVKANIINYANEKINHYSKEYEKQPGYNENWQVINTYRYNIITLINKTIDNPKFMYNYHNNVEYIMELIDYDYLEFLSNIILEHKKFLEERKSILSSLNSYLAVNKYHANCIENYKIALQNCINNEQYQRVVRHYEELFNHYKRIEGIKNNLLRQTINIYDSELKATVYDLISNLDKIMEYEAFNVDYRVLSNIKLDSNNISKITNSIKMGLLNFELMFKRGSSRKRKIPNNQY